MSTKLGRALLASSALLLADIALAERVVVEISNSTQNCVDPSEQEHRICLRSAESVIAHPPQVVVVSQNGNARITSQRVDDTARNCYLIRTHAEALGRECLRIPLVAKEVCNCRGRGWIQLRVTLDDLLGNWRLVEWVTAPRQSLRPETAVVGDLEIARLIADNKYSGVLTLTVDEKHKVVEEFQITLKGHRLELTGKVIEGDRYWSDDKLVLYRNGLTLRGRSEGDRIKFERVLTAKDGSPSPHGTN